MEFFGPKNPQEIIRNIQGFVHCPFCGCDYEENYIKIVGQFSKNYVLNLYCYECHNQVTAGITYQQEKNSNQKIKMEKLISPEKFFDLARKGPIGDEEIMDFFKAIEEFDGNFQKYIK